jgi:hypothetical protein
MEPTDGRSGQCNTPPAGHGPHPQEFGQALIVNARQDSKHLSEPAGGSSRERAVHVAAEQHAWPHRHNQTGII